MKRTHRRGIESWLQIIEDQRSSGLAVAAYQENVLMLDLRWINNRR
jgi:hypothetical protein